MLSLHSPCLEAFMPPSASGQSHLDQSISTVTIELPNRICRIAFENVIESLLWEKNVMNADGQPMAIMRLKAISKAGGGSQWKVSVLHSENNLTVPATMEHSISNVM
ncbi:unnamed protein product [Echinostoma caproni]|uniref:Checkpoint protein HUS1 n=1 Tax=Echinostoma caproni TaxID=27848 RepID=A0A183APJ1_9TREM|nr:unnamed protein product [Echinostoma caproni]